MNRTLTLIFIKITIFLNIYNVIIIIISLRYYIFFFVLFVSSIISMCFYNSPFFFPFF
ncbi:hypothetical protein HD806DRAFT_492674 [Xylariaceae sp. AK1471]|nr:hypothetical protein HD806DRAFT_515639 [Xylariaceae sp. AK1471]KAI3317327.1 hypothetical protein HD806DRAFT_515165 [Xylariaceae sp. AK1471]KAI3325337.1 hypothetical protein HD806DRAFT_492674 [Xylariaceae sp. AK1471]